MILREQMSQRQDGKSLKPCAPSRQCRNFALGYFSTIVLTFLQGSFGSCCLCTLIAFPEKQRGGLEEGLVASYDLVL